MNTLTLMVKYMRLNVTYDILGNETGLPDRVQNWAGISTQHARIIAELNDKSRKNGYGKVIDFVEKEL